MLCVDLLVRAEQQLGVVLHDRLGRLARLGGRGHGQGQQDSGGEAEGQLTHTRVGSPSGAGN